MTSMVLMLFVAVVSCALGLLVGTARASERAAGLRGSWQWPGRPAGPTTRCWMCSARCRGRPCPAVPTPVDARRDPVSHAGAVLGAALEGPGRHGGREAGGVRAATGAARGAAPAGVGRARRGGGDPPPIQRGAPCRGARARRGAARQQGAGHVGRGPAARVLEQAGMVAHADFVEQRSHADADGSGRPDVVVRLPNGRCVVIDAKAPLDAYLRATACQDDASRDRAMGEHACAVEAHAVACRDAGTRSWCPARSTSW